MTSLDSAPDSGGPELFSASYFTASAANGGHWEYARLVKEYRRNPDGWKEKYKYGKRSLVESVFGAVKVKFGGTLKSRRDNRREVEPPLKVVIYNAARANYLSWFIP